MSGATGRICRHLWRTLPLAAGLVAIGALLVAGSSGRAAPRPRSARASSPAPVIWSTARAAAGRASFGVKRGLRGRRGRPALRERRVQEGAAGKGIEPPSAIEIQLRNHPPKGLTAAAGKPNLARLAKLKPSLGGNGVWALSSFHDQEVPFPSLKDAFNSKLRLAP